MTRFLRLNERRNEGKPTMPERGNCRGCRAVAGSYPCLLSESTLFCIIRYKSVVIVEPLLGSTGIFTNRLGLFFFWETVDQLYCYFKCIFFFFGSLLGSLIPLRIL